MTLRTHLLIIQALMAFCCECFLYFGLFCTIYVQYLDFYSQGRAIFAGINGRS
jgi:hypothetical protein